MKVTELKFECGCNNDYKTWRDIRTVWEENVTITNGAVATDVEVTWEVWCAPKIKHVPFEPGNPITIQKLPNMFELSLMVVVPSPFTHEEEQAMLRQKMKELKRRFEKKDGSLNFEKLNGELYRRERNGEVKIRQIVSVCPYGMSHQKK